MLITASALNMLQDFVQAIYTRFHRTASDKTKLFLTCAQKGAGTDDAIWYKRVKHNMVAALYTYKVKKGDKDMDKSANPIYPQTVAECVTAYLQMDTFESIQRALVLLATFVACGRTSELAFCLVEDLEWDPHFNCLIITVPQMKVVDTKHVTVSCAPHFNLDFSVVFALFLNKGGYGIHDEDTPSWLLPILQTVECPGSMCLVL